MRHRRRAGANAARMSAPTSPPVPARIAFGPQVCADLGQGGEREWLLADGLRGHGMGTVSGLRTRRYHGLLTVATGLPARMLGLAALDPVLLPASGPVHLGVHEWAGGAVSPQGHLLLESFDLDDGVPRWRWRVGESVLQREVAVRHGTACVAIVDRLLARPAVRLPDAGPCTPRG